MSTDVGQIEAESFHLVHVWTFAGPVSAAEDARGRMRVGLGVVNPDAASTAALTPPEAREVAALLIQAAAAVEARS